MVTKYFSTPFANTGDKTSIPDASQPSGDVSFEEGWTPDYGKDQNTDPNAKDIPRQSENYFKFTVTEALKEIQERGFKPHDALVNYPVGAVTPGSDNIQYQCKIANGPDFLPIVDPVGDTTGTWLYANRGLIGTTLILDIEPSTTWAIQMGALAKEGQSLLDIDYPELLTFFNSTVVGGPKPFGSADGTHFFLPFDNGRIMRQWDHGAGIDPNAGTRTDRGDGTVGDNVGTDQDDDFKNHKHNLTASADTVGLGTGNFIPRINNNIDPITAGGFPTDGGNPGNETRMINVNKWIGVISR